MKKLTTPLFIALAFIIVACSSKPSEETSTETSENIEAPSETIAICMWNKLALRETPKGDGKYITAGNMGEVMTYLDSTVTDEASSKKRVYALVKLSDGTQGWMRHDLIVIDAKVAAIFSKAAICQRADLITKTDKNFEPMDIIAVLETSNGWAKVKGIIKGGTWYSEGWVQENMLTYRTPDITDAILTTKALTIENDEEKLAELKRIYELEYGEYSEFKPEIKSLIGTLDKLDKKIYDAYKCFFTNEPANYNFDTDGELVTILGNQYGDHYYSLFAAAWQVQYCLSKNEDEHLRFFNILESMSGIPLYTLLEDEAGFNYINPKFVAWAEENLIPSPQDDFLGSNLQRVYDVVFKEDVRKLDLAYNQLKNKYPNLKVDYEQKVISEGTDALEYMRTYVTQDEERDWYLEWYLAFWARREIDKSADELKKALDYILQEYDTEYYSGNIQDYPFINKYLNKKWNSVYYNDENQPVVKDEIYTVFTKKGGYYFYSFSKICDWDDDMNWYSINCDEDGIPGTCLSFYLNEENILEVGHATFCASINDNLTEYYKLIE